MSSDSLVMRVYPAGDKYRWGVEYHNQSLVVSERVFLTEAEAKIEAEWFLAKVGRNIGKFRWYVKEADD